MQLIRRLIFLLVGLLVFVFQTNAQLVDNRILETPIDSNLVKAQSISLTLSKISSVYRIPISFEPKSFEKEQKDASNLNVTSNSLENVLNELIKQDPDYKWDIVENLIRVFPEKKKDALIDQILNVKINYLSFEKRISAMGVGVSIFNTSEMQAKLTELKLSSVNFYTSFRSRRVDTNSPKSIFVFSEKTVREILDEIVKESNSKYWTIVMWGNNGEFVTIVLV